MESKNLEIEKLIKKSTEKIENQTKKLAELNEEKKYHEKVKLNKINFNFTIF